MECVPQANEMNPISIPIWIQVKIITENIQNMHEPVQSLRLCQMYM